MRLAALTLAVCLALPTMAVAQDMIGPPPASPCVPMGASNICAQEQLDFWNNLLGSVEWSPDYDYGEGEILLTADRDMRDRHAIMLRLPAAAGPQDTARLEIAVIQAVGLPWIQYWEGRIPVEEGRRLMALTDSALATLPPPSAEWGCLHSVEGAIERRRNRTLLTRGVDFCLADGQAIYPIYKAFILAAQSHAEGCAPRTGDESGDIRSLYDCLSLTGDRASAREVRTLALARLETLGEGVVWDFDVFGGGDFVVVTGWWIEAAYPPPEAGRHPFSEIWRRQNGGWVLDHALGEEPPVR